MTYPYRFQLSDPEKPTARKVPSEEKRKIARYQQAVADQQERARINSETSEVWEYE